MTKKPPKKKKAPTRAWLSASLQMGARGTELKALTKRVDDLSAMIAERLDRIQRQYNELEARVRQAPTTEPEAEAPG